MGMPVRAIVRDAAAPPDAALDACFAWLRWVDATFSTYRPESEISRWGRGALALRDAHPEVPIWCAAVDRELDERGYIRPGLGDAGDRIFGTE